MTSTTAQGPEDLKQHRRSTSAKTCRRAPFTSAPALTNPWNTNIWLSVQRVRHRIKAATYHACPQLTDKHIWDLLRCTNRVSWALSSWRRLHWSDGCRVLLQVTDGRVHIWRQGKSLFAPKHIQATIQDSTGSLTIWLCVSYGCNVDVVTMQGTLTVEKISHWHP